MRTVDFGLTWSSRTMMRGEMGSTFRMFSEALDDKRKPTSPTEELDEFFVAEDVISW